MDVVYFLFLLHKLFTNNLVSLKGWHEKLYNKNLAKNLPGVNKITAFIQPHSLPSGDSCRNLASISWISLISLFTLTSSGGSRSLAFSQLMRRDRSHGMDHWAKWSRNSSFQDSCSKRSWSRLESVWNGARQRTQRTAMNRRRAVVSYRRKKRVVLIQVSGI